MQPLDYTSKLTLASNAFILCRNLKHNKHLSRKLVSIFDVYIYVSYSGKYCSIQSKIFKKMAKFTTVVQKFFDEYQNQTPKKLKLIDAYLLYILLTGIIQFAYCVLVGTFPFNSFLSGFISTVSCFILGGNTFF